jgi:hypothetical protein
MARSLRSRSLLSTFSRNDGLLLAVVHAKAVWPLSAHPRRRWNVRFSIAAFVNLNFASLRFSPALGSGQADIVPRGSCFSSRSARGRLMMGLEGWGGSIFRAPLLLVAFGLQGLRTLRTHLIHRPREDIFLPEQNSLNFLSAPLVHAA